MRPGIAQILEQSSKHLRSVCRCVNKEDELAVSYRTNRQKRQQRWRLMSCNATGGWSFACERCIRHSVGTRRKRSATELWYPYSWRCEKDEWESLALLLLYSNNSTIIKIPREGRLLRLPSLFFCLQRTVRRYDSVRAFFFYSQA